MADQKPKRQAWHPATYDVADAHAVQAVARGKATPDQQVRAMEWIIHKACMTYERVTVVGNADASLLIAGRREAGLDIWKLANLNIEALQRRKPQRKA